MVVSDEAREAEESIIRQEFPELFNQYQKDGYIRRLIQLAINAATEKLTKLLEQTDKSHRQLEEDKKKLTKENEELRHTIATDFMAGVVIEKDKEIEELKNQIAMLHVGKYGVNYYHEQCETLTARVRELEEEVERLKAVKVEIPPVTSYNPNQEWHAQ